MTPITRPIGSQRSGGAASSRPSRYVAFFGFQTKVNTYTMGSNSTIPQAERPPGGTSRISVTDHSKT